MTSKPKGEAAPHPARANVDLDLDLRGGAVTRLNERQGRWSIHSTGRANTRAYGRLKMPLPPPRVSGTSLTPHDDVDYT